MPFPMAAVIVSGMSHIKMNDLQSSRIEPYVTFVTDTVYLNESNIHYTSVTKSRQKTAMINMKKRGYYFCE